jgi:hypothetical protein
MEQVKEIPASHERELGHELAASGDAVVVDKVGTDADRHDMYRMGKVQQMQVCRFIPDADLELGSHGDSASSASSQCSASA